MIDNMPIRAAPYDHQRQAFGFVWRLFTEDCSPGAALLMEMGTGKTITSIAAAGALYLSGRIRRLLIVAPLSVLGVWQEEFAKFADFPYTLAVLAGTGKQKAQSIAGMEGCGLRVIVVNYESAWRLEEHILAWKPDLVIADESHKIKSHTANASKFMHKFGARRCFKLLLTGTVITNKTADVYSQYKFLNPAIYPGTYWDFRNTYFDAGFYPSQLTMKPDMEREFTQRLHSVAYRATKDECLDLPEFVDIIRLVDLEPAARRAYRDLVRDSYTQLENEDTVTAVNILARLTKLSQLTGGFARGDEEGALHQISTAKLTALEDIAEEVTVGGKLVVIARFRREIDAILEMLERLAGGGKDKKPAFRYVCVHGGVKAKDRDAHVAAFQNDPEVQVFVGQISTAGLGITLTAASTMVFYSQNYSVSDFEQTKARIHRVGQLQRCTYIYLAARGTVDLKILKALQDKVELSRTIVDDYRKGVKLYG